MPTDQPILESLARLAAEFRSADGVGDTAKCARIEKSFLEELAQLYRSGWDYALGEISELPDSLMPKAYLVRRAEVLSSLEDELGEFAIAYRSSTSTQAESQAIADYHKVMNEMFRIGHWHGVPDPDSQLPLELMPPSYQERRNERIRLHRLGQTQ